MVDGKHSRSYIKTFFGTDNNPDSLSRSDAEAWLKDVKEDPKNFDTFLDNMFKGNQTYKHTIDFIKAAEKLANGKDDQYLSKDELEALKDTTTSSKPKSLPSAGKVTIVGLTSTGDNSDTIKYPNGINRGDNAVLTLSYSTDHTNINIDQLIEDGWFIAFKRGAANGQSVFSEGEGDLVTLVATKKMNGNEDNKSYKIPTKNGKNDVSAQMTVIRNGNIDIKKMTNIADDGKSAKTVFKENNTYAPLFLYVASADDPANYLQNNLTGFSGVTHFGAARHGDDAGATFVSSDDGGGNIDFNYSGGGGRNDQSLTIPIVFE